jgi:ribosomal protein S27AE
MILKSLKERLPQEHKISKTDKISVVALPEVDIPNPPEVKDVANIFSNIVNNNGITTEREVDKFIDGLNKIINQKDFNFNIKELSEKIVDEIDRNDTKVVKSVKVKCEKCGKFMTEHTKRFTHDAKCKGVPPEKRKLKDVLKSNLSKMMESKLVLILNNM